MITIATNLIVRPSLSSSSNRIIDPVTKLSHASHNRSDIPMQQQQQQQLEHCYTHPSLNNSDLGLDMNNMTSLDASNLLHQHDQSFNYNQIMTNYSKNWSERILQDITGLLHVLSPTGKILYCSSSCISIIGFQPEELVGRPLTDFIHVDDLDLFIQNFQLAFSSMSRIKTHYRLRCKDNSFVLLESIGHPKQDVVSEPPQYFFAIAQPYLSRSNGLMESFLEMKSENEWLKKRLEGFLNMGHSPPISAVEPTCSQLQINVQQSQQQYHIEHQPYAFYNDPYNPNDKQQQQLQQRLQEHQQLQHQQQHYLQQQHHHQQQYQQQKQLQPQQQIQINQSSRRPSIVSVKMDDQWNYSPSVASSSDLMNRYQTEETNTITATTTTMTSTATTTANTATTSTVTMPIKTTATTASYSSSDNTLMSLPDVVRKDKWKRRKKQTNVEYLCTDCGTTSSPEWRKGPHGPKTLCNACGLRWAKKNKKI